MKKFILLAILLILTRFADAQTTYLYTPDLDKEANPLVLLLGFGWTGIIITEAAGLALLLYALWVYCFAKVEVPEPGRHMSLKSFVSLFYFGDTNSFYKLFYKLPTSKNSLLYSLGYILTYSLIVVSAVTAGSTTLLSLSKQYRIFYTHYHLPAVLYLLCIITVLFFSVKFYRKELHQRRSCS